MPEWWEIENRLLAPIPMELVLEMSFQDVDGTSIIISDTQWAYKFLANKLKTKNKPSINLPIWFNPDLKIQGKTVKWKSWYSHGIWSLGQLFQDSKWKTFDALQEEFGMPQSSYYQWLQLKHCVNKSNLILSPLVELSEFIKFISSLANESWVASQTYKII